MIKIVQSVNTVFVEVDSKEGQIMKKILISVLLFLGAALSFGLGGFLIFAENCETICGEVLRLHIPANSDEAADQKIKLRLRDYILEEFSGEFSSCSSLENAEETAESLLREIEERSNNFLEEHGFFYGAKAELVTMDFPTREYEKLILPAGRYRAIRVTLGSGEGHNWWCVIFPQLCLPAASESKQASDVLADFGKPQGITVKFALYEWLQGLF